MHQLVYVSSTRAGFSEGDLQDLLCRARETNKILGVTGMLVFLDGCFLQVLEGRRECVRDLYAKIETDPRHFDAKVLIETEIAKPAFPDWSMGYRKARGDDLYMAGFCALTRRALDGRTGRTDAKVLRTIVKTFYRTSAPVTGVERDPVLSLA